MDARRLIFWLFVLLAAGTAISLLLFVHNVGDCDADGVDDRYDTAVVCPGREPYDGTRVPILVYRSLAGDLAAPVLVWFLLKGIGDRARRARWFTVGVVASAAVGLATIGILVAVGEMAHP